MTTLAEQLATPMTPSRTPTSLDILALMTEALSARMFRLLTLLLAFALFGYTALVPDWTRLAAAIAFTVLVHAPTWWRKERV